MWRNLEKLVDAFPRDIGLARQVESPNPEDNLAIKTAIVGFSYKAATQQWSRGHYEFINQQLAAEFDDDRLAEYGENGENVRLFHALALGFLLGFYQQKAIDDQEFQIAQLQIAGLTMLHLPKITAVPLY